MKQLLFYGFLLLGSGMLLAQSRLRTSEGEIRFNASSPLEDIEAVNTQASAIIDGQTGDLAVVLLIKHFEFRRKLMQEHFNENFMESDTYPKAIFTGKLKSFYLNALSPTPMSLQLLGEITIHGISRPLDTHVQLRNAAGTLYLSTNFIIAPEDHNIDVPKILFNKIAEKVAVDVRLSLRPMTASPPD